MAAHHVNCVKKRKVTKNYTIGILRHTTTNGAMLCKYNII